MSSRARIRPLELKAQSVTFGSIDTIDQVPDQSGEDPSWPSGKLVSEAMEIGVAGKRIQLVAQRPPLAPCFCGWVEETKRIALKSRRLARFSLESSFAKRVLRELIP